MQSYVLTRIRHRITSITSITSNNIQSHAIICNHARTRIRHRPRVEADEIESFVNAPDEGGNPTHSDSHQTPSGRRRELGRYSGDDREIFGRWPEDSGEMAGRCTFEGGPSSFRPGDGVGYA